MTTLIFSVVYWILFLRKLAQLEDLKGLYPIFQVYSSIGKGVPRCAVMPICEPVGGERESRAWHNLSRIPRAKKISVILGGLLEGSITYILG